MTFLVSDAHPLAPAPPPVASEDRRRLVRQVRTTGRARAVGVSIVLAGASLLCFCLSISVGDFPIPLADVVPAVLGFGNPDSDFIIRTLRLPRALTAVLVGGAFGFSGAIFQWSFAVRASLTRHRRAWRAEHR